MYSEMKHVYLYMRINLQVFSAVDTAVILFANFTGHHRGVGEGRVVPLNYSRRFLPDHRVYTRLHRDILFRIRLSGRRHTGFPQTRRAMQIFAGRSPGLVHALSLVSPSVVVHSLTYLLDPRRHGYRLRTVLERWKRETSKYLRSTSAHGY